MKKLLLFTAVFITASLFAIGQGNENFTNYPETANAYHSGTFTGMDGSTWTYSSSRGDSVIVAPSPTLGKARNPTAMVLSGTIHNGCGTIKFDYKQPFTTKVNLNLFINGTMVKNVVSTTQGVVVNSGLVVVNIPGDFTIMIKQADSLNSGQATIDNIIWTSYSGGAIPEPTNYPTAFTATPLPFAIGTSWIDATGAQVPAAYLLLASDQNNITAPVDGTPVADDAILADGHAALNILQGVQSATFANLPGNKHYYFKIYPYTNSGALIDYKTDGTVPSASALTPNTVIIDSINFNNKTFGDWLVRNVIGDQVWLIDSIHGINGGPCGKMSGFAGSALVNEDWLISPLMNFNNYTNEALTFLTAKNYTGPDLEPLISNDYDGGATPGNFTWTPLTATLSPGGWAWTPSGVVNVSGTAGENVHIGFRFTSTAAASATWELDDVIITGDLIIGMDEKTANDGGFSVNPNPASGKCNLKFFNDGKKEIRVISVIGNTVMESSTDQMNYSLNLNFLSSGIYFIQVNSPTSKATQVRKLIVQ